MGEWEEVGECKGGERLKESACAIEKERKMACVC